MQIPIRFCWTAARTTGIGFLFCTPLASVTAQTPNLVPSAVITATQALINGITPGPTAVPQLHGPFPSPCSADGGRAYSQLVTRYTYHRIVEKDLATILAFENTVNSGASYASLSVDGDKTSFALAPYNIAIRKGSFPSRRTIGLVNLQLKGKVNSQEIASVYSGKSFSKDYSVSSTVVLFFKSKEKWAVGADAGRYCAFRATQATLPAKIAADYAAYRSNATAPAPNNAYLEHAEDLTSTGKLQEAMLKDFSAAEEGLAKPFWTASRRCWVSITPSFVSQENQVYDSLKKGVESNVLRGFGLRLGGNFLYRFVRRRAAFYATAYYEGKPKNIFTAAEQATVDVVSPAGAGSVLVTESKQVYQHDGSADGAQYCHGGGLQLIGIKYFKQTGLGFNLSFSTSQLAKPAGNEKQPFVFSESYGLIIPLEDKAGDPTINVEVFYAKDRYGELAREDKEYTGLRFTLPIFSKKG